MLPFAVVEFPNDGLAVISTKWFTGPDEGECYWPPPKTNFTRAAMKERDPSSDWVKFKVTVRRKAATYDIAHAKLLEEEHRNSDVATDPECSDNMGRGKRKRRAVVMSSEDEDDDDIHEQASPSLPRLPSTLQFMQMPPPLHPPHGSQQPPPLPRPPSTLQFMQMPPPLHPPHGSQQTPPPGSQQTPPPRSLQTPPSRSLQTPPPGSLQTPPPGSLQTPPPRSLQTPPPGSLQTPPPGAPQTPPPLHRATGALQAAETPTTHESSIPRQNVRDGMFRRILTLLENMKDTQLNHGRILQALLQKQDNVADLTRTPEGFPLKTINDVICMEEKLANPTFMSELIAAVADIGGATVDGATRRMMAFLLEQKLAQEYNFLGRNGKRSFKPLKLFEVFYDSALGKLPSGGETAQSSELSLIDSETEKKDDNKSNDTVDSCR
ncbi:YLP motif-containing protein 1-like [Engraulis encrasicolus]|uniref:YLP motif-containing protein 1-like n=1 Tax=Engraulis encrasicolus TaxID=184585 RepID=UPI002FD6B1EF